MKGTIISLKSNPRNRCELK